MTTVTDIFAGAGGSSTGMASVPGIEVAVAANHWALAVEVHGLNHGDTDHMCVDLHMEDPRNFPSTDILWASPECTKWSQARGKTEALTAELGGDPTLFDSIPVELETTEEDEISRSRLLMFDVLRFVEHHRYRAVIVENVVDVATQAKYSRAWELWRRGLDRLGYAFRVVSLNAMHSQMAGAPAPQSRDRLYVVAWPKGEKAPDIDRALSPQAWCQRCERIVRARQAWKPGRTVGRYRAQYRYACGDCGRIVEPGWLPASEAIDWSLPAERIGDRTKPLSEKTMARIREGLRRYGGAFHLHTAPTEGLVLDAVRSAPIIRHTEEPLATQTTAYTRSLLIPVEGRDGKRARNSEEVLRTMTTRNETGLLIPSGGTWHETAYPTDQAMRTVTTRENHGLLVPYYSASETAKLTTDPIGTLTCVDRYALVTLRGENRPKPVSEPMDTVCASGNHHGLVDVSEDDVMACRFRMLEPSEIAAGMAFPRGYRWQGTKRERVRLAGNAVCPPSARDLMTVVAESIEATA